MGVSISMSSTFIKINKKNDIGEARARGRAEFIKKTYLGGFNLNHARPVALLFFLMRGCIGGVSPPSFKDARNKGLGGSIRDG